MVRSNRGRFNREDSGPVTHQTEDWVGPTADLNALEVIKSLPLQGDLTHIAELSNPHSSQYTELRRLLEEHSTCTELENSTKLHITFHCSSA